jgi:5-methylcytosine-specific restriction endonuclease McrA
LIAALLVICADVVADQMKHINGHFTSIIVITNDLIGNRLPILLPIIPPGANPSGAANFNKEQTPNSFMTDILNKSIVLVFNRNWQAINIRTPQEAFCQMATNVATGLEIEGENHIRPVTWDEWITLPIRDGDNAVRTVRGAIRVPTVIVAVNFAKVPKKRPKLCARTIRERDGNRCQYTGALLRPDEGSLDHVVPRSRGGPDQHNQAQLLCTIDGGKTWNVVPMVQQH